MFETKIEKILEKVEQIEPLEYGKTRNFTDGAVTKLSPYISRGVISTKYVLETVLKKNYKFMEIERFVQELAWREYFQNVWSAAGDGIDDDFKQPQTDVGNSRMPSAIINAETGIEAIDRGINNLYETGYVHNHLRMYIASVVCNLAKSHWKLPAQWFYYHLLDADWASNALSWQWTSAAFSNKKYYANQENINKYCGTDQHETFLDVAYEAFPKMEIPDALKEIETPILKTILPENTTVKIDNSLPTVIYNFYNLDPFWKKDVAANRVLLLEPAHFEKYPVSSKTIEFVMELAKNIDGIQVFIGEFDELVSENNLSEIYFKEHPTNTNYKGIEDPRDWMFPEIRNYYPSFFGYWKKCEKPLKLWIHQIKRS